MKNSLLKILLAVGLVISLSACEEKGPLEKAGEKADEAIEEAGDKIEDAADKAEDATD